MSGILSEPVFRFKTCLKCSFHPVSCLADGVAEQNVVSDSEKALGWGCGLGLPRCSEGYAGEAGLIAGGSAGFLGPLRKREGSVLGPGDLRILLCRVSSFHCLHGQGCGSARRIRVPVSGRTDTVNLWLTHSVFV